MAVRLYSPKWLPGKGCESKQEGSNLRKKLRILLREPRKTTKILTQGSRCVGKDLKQHISKTDHKRYCLIQLVGCPGSNLCSEITYSVFFFLCHCWMIIWIRPLFRRNITYTVQKMSLRRPRNVMVIMFTTSDRRSGIVITPCCTLEGPWL
jgi:hypothetical protein